MNISRIFHDPALVIDRIRLELISLVKQKFDPPASSLGGYKRIYHAHVRKCAGTSLNKSIIAALGGSEMSYSELARHPAKSLLVGGRPVVGWNRRMLNKEAFFYGFSHIPYHEFNFSSDTFRFTFLRDPIDRIISHFRMLKDMEQEESKHPAFVAEKSWVKADFDTFIQELPRLHLENQLYMFSGTFDVDEALKNLATVNYVGHVNSIASKFVPLLNEEFGLSIDYSPLRASRHPFQITNEQSKALSQKLMSEIAFYEAACEKFDLL